MTSAARKKLIERLKQSKFCVLCILPVTLADSGREFCERSYCPTLGTTTNKINGEIVRISYIWFENQKASSLVIMWLKCAVLSLIECNIYSGGFLECVLFAFIVIGDIFTQINRRNYRIAGYDGVRSKDN